MNSLLSTSRAIVCATLAALALPASAASITCPVADGLIVTGQDRIGSAFCVMNGPVEIMSGGSLRQNAGGSMFYQGPSFWTGRGGTVQNGGVIENTSAEFMNLGRLENEAGAHFLNRGQLSNGLDLRISQPALMLNSGTFTNAAGASFSSNASLVSSGSIVNHGAITHTGPGVLSVSGSFTGSGSFYSNGGVLEVLAGGQVEIGSSGNLQGGKLRSGDWRVMAGSGAASLAIGSGAIHTLEQGTFVTLSGAGASFDQLAGLSLNQGELTIADRSHTLGAPFTNLGRVVAAEGGHITVSGSTQLAGGVLSGGTWQVAAGNGSASLSFEGGPIHTLGAAAHVLVSGAGARFDTLATLERNNGLIDLGVNHSYTVSSNLVNAGQINVNGRLVNQGQFTMLPAPSSLVNRGVVENAAGASFLSSGFFGNFGEVVNAGDMRFHDGFMQNDTGALLRNLAGAYFKMSGNGPGYGQGNLVNTTFENAGRAEVASLVLMDGLTLRNQAGGEFVWSGTADSTQRGIDNRIENAGDFLLSGSFRRVVVDNQSTGVFENTGRLETYEVNNRGSFINRGHVQLFRSSATITNEGHMVNERTMGGGHMTNQAPGRLVNNGDIDVGRFANAGSLSGTGWVIGRESLVVTSTGVVAPGNSIGTMRLGSSEWSAIDFDGTLEIEIDGDEHDTLWVIGGRGLRFGDHAALRFKLLGVPVLDQDMGFLLADLLEGFDADVSLFIEGLADHIGWRVWESGEDLFIRFFSMGGGDGGTVPLPGTWLLAGLALLALPLGRTRRWVCQGATSDRLSRPCLR